MCSRYAFPPNSLHYCGPEKQADLLGYLQNYQSDPGLKEILDHFETLYPYLKLIAASNDLKDPFDPRVVDAYWLGNRLLNKVKISSFVDHLSEGLQLKKKLPRGDLSPMLDHAVSGLPNHTSHVLHIYRRTGHLPIKHTLVTMDNCRISWGKVIAIPPLNLRGGKGELCFIVAARPLAYLGNRLILSLPQERHVTSPFTQPQVGDWVSLHWGLICDTLTPSQLRALIHYTNLALQHVNNSPTGRP